MCFNTFAKVIICNHGLDHARLIENEINFVSNLLLCRSELNFVKICY